MVPVRRLLLFVLSALMVLVITPGVAAAQVHQHTDENGAAMIRSLESLRDLDYDSWQAVAYRIGDPGTCLLYTSPSPRDRTRSRMPSSA